MFFALVFTPRFYSQTSCCVVFVFGIFLISFNKARLKQKIVFLYSSKKSQIKNQNNFTPWLSSKQVDSFNRWFCFFFNWNSCVNFGNRNYFDF